MCSVECIDIYVSVDRSYSCYFGEGGVKVRQFINGGSNFTPKTGANNGGW